MSLPKQSNEPRRARVFELLHQQSKADAYEVPEDVMARRVDVKMSDEDLAAFRDEVSYSFLKRDALAADRMAASL